MRLLKGNSPVSLYPVIVAFCLVIKPLSAAGEDYQAIDRHALNAPKEAEESIETLVDYLIEPARNDRERLRAVFRWITANIVYDTEGFFASLSAMKQEADSGTVTTDTVLSEVFTPEMVLEKRVADCDGYSMLMEAMTETLARRVRQYTDLARKATELEIHQIKGFAKGYGYKVGSDFSGSNHAWNAVNLDGRWLMIDCTWGAGRPNEKGEFVPEFEDYYFLTPPEELIYTHFPDDVAWQRIEKPVSKEEFIGLAFLWPSFFKYGMKVGSHPNSVIETGNSVEISLYAPDSVLFDADMVGQNRLLEPHYTFVQQDGEQCQLRAVFPSPGEYVLRLFSKLKGEEGTFKETLNYKIIADSGAGDQAGFPLTYEPFQQRRAYLYLPLTRSLEAGKNHAFKLKVPEAKNVAVVTGGEWHQLIPRDGVFEGDVETEAGPVEVYARFPGSFTYDCLLEYDSR